MKATFNAELVCTLHSKNDFQAIATLLQNFSTLIWIDAAGYITSSSKVLKGENVTFPVSVFNPDEFNAYGVELVKNEISFQEQQLEQINVQLAALETNTTMTAEEKMPLRTHYTEKSTHLKEKLKQLVAELPVVDEKIVGDNSERHDG